MEYPAYPFPVRASIRAYEKGVQEVHRTRAREC